MGQAYAGEDIYCDLIVPGVLPVRVVKETSDVLAFWHTQPKWPIHVVVAPKTHIPSLVELDAGSASKLLDVLKEVAASVVADVGSCRVVTNLGSYQDSKHLHFHVYSDFR